METHSNLCILETNNSYLTDSENGKNNTYFNAENT